MIHSLHHVQLAMPAGEEQRAREFYGDLLGIPETPKPEGFANRGGVWFEDGELRVHLGVEANFKPARKAHPALRVHNFDTCLARLDHKGCAYAVPSHVGVARRTFVDDPFGNRVELIEDTRPECGFVVLYQWRLAESRIADFREAWSEMTKLIAEHGGGLGSRLHRGEGDAWMAYAQWPSRNDWERFQQQETLSEEFSRRMQAAVVERLPTLTFVPDSDLWSAVRVV